MTKFELSLALAALIDGAYAFHILTRPEPARTQHLRASESARMSVAVKREQSSCLLLSNNEMKTVRELLDEKNGPVLVCDEPVNDPSLTCFLAPENWSNEVGAEDLASKYICVPNQEPWQKTHSEDMNAEDSY